MRNDYEPNYLAHSKGPWKKHKYIKKVGNRYYYAGSKGYYKALATDPNAVYNTTKSQRDAAKRVNARNAQAANLKRASRKQRLKNVGVSARLTAQKAGRTAAGAATNAVNKITGTTVSQRRAKARVAKRAVSKAATNVKNTAKKTAWRADLAVKSNKRRLKRTAQVSSMRALNSVRSARKKGAAAITNLANKIKTNARKRKNDRTWAGNLKRARKNAKQSKKKS